ncbi:MAG TPA: hypothetical protein VMA73_27060 [Streptosporangiaceae bacterium]|nr:hypothetical protein [Streptosporangiaceae bacterium]
MTGSTGHFIKGRNTSGPDDPAAPQLAIRHAPVTPAGSDEFYVTGVDAVAIGEAAKRAGAAVYQLVTQQADLEATFLELTTGKAAIQ